MSASFAPSMTCMSIDLGDVALPEPLVVTVQVVAAYARTVDADAQDRRPGGRAARGEEEVAERPGDERLRARPVDPAEHVRVRAEHDLSAAVQACGRELLLARVRLGVQLEAPVEEADDDIGAASGSLNVQKPCGRRDAHIPGQGSPSGQPTRFERRADASAKTGRTKQRQCYRCCA